MGYADKRQLEKKYAAPAGKSLFLGSEEGKALARFFETYPKINLGTPLAPLACTGVRSIQMSFLSCAH